MKGTPYDAQRDFTAAQRSPSDRGADASILVVPRAHRLIRRGMVIGVGACNRPESRAAIFGAINSAAEASRREALV
jgi:hypothetical protein